MSKSKPAAKPVAKPAATSRKRRAPRTYAKRDGVYLACAPSGVYYLRFRDPATGKWARQSCKTRDRAAAERARSVKAAHFARAAADRYLLAVSKGEDPRARMAPATQEQERFSIDAVLADYYRKLALARNRSPHTLQNTERLLQMFRRWCHEMSLEYLDELTPLTLSRYHDYLLSRRRRDGKRYKISWVNQHQKPLATALRRAVQRGYAPHLNSDVIRGALEYTPIGSSAAKAEHGLETARPLAVAELQSLLRITLQSDVALAVDVALLLLSGLRIGEYTALRLGHVAFTDDELASIDVPGLIAKNHKPRAVHFRGYSPLGAELLAALQRPGYDPQEWLSRYSYERLRYRVGKACDWKASAHDLRATCATYTLALAGIDRQLRGYTQRMGHGLDVADESYVRPPSGIRFQAESLEHAMHCESELRAIVRAARREQWQRSASPRATSRWQPRGLLLEPLR